MLLGKKCLEVTKKCFLEAQFSTDFFFVQLCCERTYVCAANDFNTVFHGTILCFFLTDLFVPEVEERVQEGLAALGGKELEPVAQFRRHQKATPSRS